jgi:hypothetical protein
MLNTRMKDFWDLSIIARQFPFRGPLLCRAIRATFERRRTPEPGESPGALTAAFHDDTGKQKDWQAFVKRPKLEAAGDGLERVVAILNGFLMPPAQALARDEPFEMEWPAGGPWLPTA